MSKPAGQFPSIGLVIVKGRVLAHISGDETSASAGDRVAIYGAVFVDVVSAGGQDDLQDFRISGHVHVSRVDIGDAGGRPKGHGGSPGLALGYGGSCGVAVIQLVLRLLRRKGKNLHLCAWQGVRGDDEASAAGVGNRAVRTIRGGHGAGTGLSLAADDGSLGVPKKLAVRISLSWASAIEDVPSGIGSGDRLLVDGTKGNAVANGVFTVGDLKKTGVVEPAPFVVELTGLQVERIHSSRPEIAGKQVIPRVLRRREAGAPFGDGLGDPGFYVRDNGEAPRLLHRDEIVVAPTLSKKSGSLGIGLVLPVVLG